MISKLITKFKNFRFTYKLIITYILLTVIPMAFLGYVSYYQYTKSIEQQAGEFYPTLLKQANMNIDQQLAEIQKLNELLYSSPSVMSILRKQEYPNQSTLMRDKFELNTYLSNTYLSGIHYDILAVFIKSNGRLFYSSRVPINEDYIEGNLQNNSVTSVVPYFETELRFNAHIPFLLLEREIIDFDNRRTLGTMHIAVDLRFVDRVIEDLQEEAELWIMNENHHILYHTNHEQIGTFYGKIDELPFTYGSIKTRTQDENEVISISASENNEWILLHSIPVKYLTDQTDFVRNITVLIFLAFAVISVFFSVLLAWNVTKPIHKLRLLMKDVEKGNFDVDISIGSKDEVGMLARSFNSMVSKIKELIRANYQTALRQREAELYALQSQINPHFMYNTLETINMSVEEGETDTVVDMVSLLGQMLRYSLSNKDEVVSVSQEVSHINDFLTIQKYRFEDRLFFSVVEEIDGTQYNTPKFILQPIVENAVKYTVEKREHAVITLKVQQESGDIVFSIEDNGPGIEIEKLQQLERLLQEDPMSKKDTSFGLVNVHSRIVIMYGEKYGITISSTENVGTKIVIRIPALTHNKKEVDGHEKD